MVNESKSSVLNVRIRPSVKAMLERVAEAERRSQAQMVEIAIEECAERRAKKKPAV